MTKPIEDILPLPMSPEHAKVMHLFYSSIHEIVCFGTHVMAWNLEKAKGQEEQRNETDIVDTIMFRHILELLDSISVQIANGVIVPCKIQLRALLEACLCLEYLYKSDTKRKSSAYLIVSHYEKLDFYKKLIPDTRENKDFLASLKNGFIIKEMPAISGVHKAYLNQQNLIDRPIYKEVKKEYLRLAAKKPHVKWYSLFSGIASVKQLAKALGKADLYELMYNPWSTTIHASDLTHGVLVKGDDGYGAINQIRNLEESYSITLHTMSLGQLAVDLVIKKSISNPEYKTIHAKWFLSYKEQFRDPIEKLRSKSHK